MNPVVKVVQLYPEELGVAGDRGNVMAIMTRLSRAGIESELVEYRRGDTIPVDADLVVTGSGPLSAMRNVVDDLHSSAETLTTLLQNGVPLFAFGSGAELFGHDITLLDGSKLAGLGLLPFRAVRTIRRRVAYVLTDTSEGRLVGFEDHASDWVLDPGASAFGTLVVGGGNGDGTLEGVRTGSAIGTQVGGPVLPLNPMLTDAIIRLAAERRGLVYRINEAHADLDHYAEQARDMIVRHAGEKFTSI